MWTRAPPAGRRRTRASNRPTERTYGAAMPNRLADAVSPYLRARRTTPSTGTRGAPEAFAEAARRDVPVLVSIGYATCHWCHVMARESFSDPRARRAPERRTSSRSRSTARSIPRSTPPTCGRERLHAEPRLAAQRVRDARGPRFFAGTYLPPRAGRGAPVVPAGARRGARGLVDRRERGRAVGGRARRGTRAGRGGRRLPTSALGAGDFARVVAELAGYEDRRVRRLRRERRSSRWRRCSAVARARRLAAAVRRRPAATAGRGPGPRGDAARRPARPGRGRLLPVRHPARLDRAALRAHALPTTPCCCAAYAAVGDRATAAGIVSFLAHVLRRPSRGVRLRPGLGERARRAPGRGRLLPRSTPRPGRSSSRPPSTGRCSPGWNGLAIGGLADAGARFGEPALAAPRR